MTSASLKGCQYIYRPSYSIITEYTSSKTSIAFSGLRICSRLHLRKRGSQALCVGLAQSESCLAGGVNILSRFSSKATSGAASFVLAQFDGPAACGCLLLCVCVCVFFVALCFCRDPKAIRECTSATARRACSPGRWALSSGLGDQRGITKLKKLELKIHASHRHTLYRRRGRCFTFDGSADGYARGEAPARQHIFLLCLRGL